MKELAAICKVSVATVSYALRDDPRISEPVRKRIQAKAREHNYHADSQSSALVRYRKHGSNPRSSVAVIYAHPRTSRRTALIQPHLDIFRQTIARYGYEVREFFLGNRSNSAELLAKRLHAEGIRGVVLAWGQWEDRLDGFPWSEFTVASAERNEIHPALDRVSLNHFSAADESFHRLEALGVQRIGLVCHDDLPARVRKNIVGAYLMNVHQHATWATEIPPFFYTLGETPERFSEWFDRWQPDALLSHRLIDRSFFSKAEVEFPRDAQYAVIEIDDAGRGGESGVLVNEELGRVLAETIAGKLHYDERVDTASEGHLILVDGQWHSGETTSCGNSAPIASRENR